nr:unnamed protein product [Callosobruchus chinensis]
MKTSYYPLIVATLLLTEIACIPSDYQDDDRADHPFKRLVGKVIGGVHKVIGRLNDGLIGQDGILRCRPLNRYYDYDYYGEDGEKSEKRKRDVSDVDGSRKDSLVDSPDAGGNSTDKKGSDQQDLEAICQTHCLEASTLGGFIFKGICYCLYF